MERALDQDFRHIKLREIRLDTIRAARAACGMDIWLSLDATAHWSVIEAIGGFLAWLHLAAALAPGVAFELFFGQPQASPYHDAVAASGGELSVPTGPGPGFAPDLDVIARHRLGSPVVIAG